MKFKILTQLEDIKMAIADIEEYCAGHESFSEIVGNKMKRLAIERCFEIMGESVNRLVKMESEFSLTSAKEVVDMRNRITHEYDRLDWTILWHTIQNNFTALKEEVHSLIEFYSKP